MGWLDDLKKYEGAAELHWDTLQLDRLMAIVEELEWSGILCDDDPQPMCPKCLAFEGTPHKETCFYHENWKP